MARIGWRGGRPIQDAGRRLSQRADAIRTGSEEALENSLEEGGGLLQDYLEAAHTRTGERRVESGEGQFAGRHVTGNMVGSVSWELRERRKSGVTDGVFGWWGENYEEYFEDQDKGEGDIPAARALPQAFVEARERFRARIAAVMESGSIE